MSIPKFSVANRLTEQVLESKRRSSIGRRESVPFDSVDSGIYGRNAGDDHNVANDYYENELQLRVDSFDDRNVKL